MIRNQILQSSVERAVTDQLLMIRPANFRMNEQTAVNNHFQTEVDMTAGELSDEAMRLFDSFVLKLRDHGVKVIVVEASPSTDTPDVIFPNNWVSFHEDGTLVLYPMFAENRRRERRADITDLLNSAGYEVKRTVDLSPAEMKGVFLEGTGSLVLDRANRIAYCALSPRSDMTLLQKFCEELDYKAVPFRAMQTLETRRVPIYHTNVMMAVAETFAIVCLDCIDDPSERAEVLRTLVVSGKCVLTITEEQVHKFAGNMLQVVGEGGRRFLVMSDAAFQSLSQDQLETIRSICGIIHSPLSTIEKCGGGSARCMLAEVFLPKL